MRMNMNILWLLPEVQRNARSAAGAGDRLGLQCERSGKSVPTAMLPYCGRTLLEGLVRDLQASV